MNAIRYLSFISILLLGAVQAQALNILLTNDDGYDHPWVNAVREKLMAAGHQVTLVGPAVNQSGQSAALTLDALRRGGEALRNPQPGIYAVEGTPATAVIMGVQRVMPARPDLVVSGTNDGANIGVLSSFSGTVGATVAALNLLGEPVPAIAISANRLNPAVGPGVEPNLGHAEEIAGWLVELIARLEATRGEGEPLLPHGIALNINYPAVPSAQVKGAGIYRHGRIERALFGEEGASTRPTAGRDAADERWDTTALEQGFITIVPIDGDYTAPDWRTIVPEERLGARSR